MIDMAKQYQTRSGRPVRILCTDGPGSSPVIGISDGNVFTWTANGETGLGLTCKDLIEVPRRIKRTVWINVYTGDQVGDTVHETRQQANACDCLTAGRRIACVRVDIDCAEGEGL